MQNELQLAADLSLPLNLITQTIAILGNRGSGKTNTAVVLAEELLNCEQQVIIFDPLDCWYGLRSMRADDAPGFEIPVFGGAHSDLPLIATAGAMVADVIVDRNIPAILSMRHFETQADQRRFVTDFCRRFFYIKGQPGKQTPVMVVFDEAGTFVPQRVGPEEAQMVGAIQKIVRQGRASGLGVMLIDQRAATVNKDVLTQLEMLIAHRTTSPQDRKAIKEWMEGHDEGSQVKTVMSSIATLKIGEAWLWSPGWLDLFQKVQVRARSTFDSSATPKTGERRVVPTRIAPVDIEAIREQMTDVAEDDALIERGGSKHYLSKIRDLEAQVEHLQQRPESEPLVVPAFSPEDTEAISGLYARLENLISLLMLPTPANMPGVMVEENIEGADLTADGPFPIQTRTTHYVAEKIASSGKLPTGEHAILTAVAQYPRGVTKEQLGILTGYKRSSRDTYLQRLKEKTLVKLTAEGLCQVTAIGQKALGPNFKPLPTGAPLREYWICELPGGEKRIFQALLKAHPKGLLKTEIDKVTGYKRSSRDTYLQRLSARQLIKTSGSRVTLNPILYQS